MGIVRRGLLTFCSGEQETSGTTRVVRVGRLDSMIAGSPVSVVAGPFVACDDAGLRRRLDEFSERIPTNRVGLTPSRTTTRWVFAGGYGAHAVGDAANGHAWDRPCRSGPDQDASHDDADDVSPMLNRLIATRPDEPIAATFCGEMLSLRFDHGVGDAHILMSIMAALSGGASGVSSSQRADLQIAAPAWRALLEIIRRYPRPFLRDCVQTARRVLRSKRDGVTGRGSGGAPANVAAQQDYCAVYVKSDVKYLERLRGYRDSQQLSVSLPALTLWSLCRSLETQGIGVQPDAEVVVDLRKFLPKGRTTSGNFLAVARMRCDEATSLEHFGRVFGDTIASTKPVINLIGSICISWVRSAVFRRAPGDWAPAPGRRDGLATITYSDISKLDERRDVAWADSDRRDLAVALPPASESHIAILVCETCPGQIALTASFFASKFDPTTVQRALAQAVAGFVDGESLEERLRGIV